LTCLSQVYWPCPTALRKARKSCLAWPPLLLTTLFWVGVILRAFPLSALRIGCGHGHIRLDRLSLDQRDLLQDPLREGSVTSRISLCAHVSKRLPDEVRYQIVALFGRLIELLRSYYLDRRGEQHLLTLLLWNTQTTGIFLG